MTVNIVTRRAVALCASLVAGSFCGLPVSAGTLVANQAVSAVATPGHYLPNRLPRRAGMYYGMHWGVDKLSVKAVESGEIIRFSYRVLDANKAKVLSDKKTEPSLIDPQVGVELVIPSLEQVGQLRQTAAPEAGKSYWMAFSNQGRRVKRGDRVSVLIGLFRADGLVVE